MEGKKSNKNRETEEQPTKGKVETNSESQIENGKRSRRNREIGKKTENNPEKNEQNRVCKYGKRIWKRKK